MLEIVRKAARRKILFLSHAVRQMERQKPEIERIEIENAIMQGEAIEEYPDDPRGQSCLILGSGGERPIHVVCAPKGDYLAIVTAYRPDPQKWSRNFRKRL